MIHLPFVPEQSNTNVSDNLDKEQRNESKVANEANSAKPPSLNSSSSAHHIGDQKVITFPIKDSNIADSTHPDCFNNNDINVCPSLVLNEKYNTKQTDEISVGTSEKTNLDNDSNGRYV